MTIGHRVSVIVALVCLAFVPSAQAEPLITFDDLPIDTITPFVLTVDGVEVGFVGDSFPFVIDDVENQGGGDGALFSGNGLFDIDGLSGALAILFDTAVSSITIPFAINTGGTLSLFALLGPNLVGIDDFAPSVTDPNAPFAFGIASFDDAPFDFLVLAPSTPDFGVDNIAFTAVPEPASMLLLGTAGLGLLARARRRRSRLTE